MRNGFEPERGPSPGRTVPTGTAGLPATIVYGATSPRTTDPAPTMTPFPRRVPPRTTDRRPIQQSSPITMLGSTASRDSARAYRGSVGDTGAGSSEMYTS